MSSELVQSRIRSIDVAFDYAIVDLRPARSRGAAAIPRHIVKINITVHAVVPIDVLYIHHAVHHRSIHRYVCDVHAVIDIYIAHTNVVSFYVGARPSLPFFVSPPSRVEKPVVLPVGVPIEPNPNVKTSSERKSEAESAVVVASLVINNCRI